jgi:hypothetical protein
MEMLNLLTPLKVILNPPSLLESYPGENVTLHVSLINQGEQGAVIDVFIDRMAQPLLQWCSSPRQRVALDPRQGCEVSFQFNIPWEALPGSYSYTVVVDAPEHYPEETPIYGQGQLEVLVKESSIERLDRPNFSLTPLTSPDKPLQIEADQIQKLTVKVDNRSNRVDRFRLACLDLDEKWFTVKYPCTELSERGVVANAESLELNPRTQGDISIEFHYPMDMPAGQYSPTLQLLSDNLRKQVFLDLVYLEVKPKLNLSIELETILGKVSHSPGQYRLTLANHGNSIRELAVSASSRDETDTCKYVCNPSSVNLLIGETSAISLKVYPTQKWRRPFFGHGLNLPFKINLQDLQALPTPEKLPMGVLVWKARPWWQFLLWLLAGVGALSGLGFLIWFIFFKPSPPPVLTEFKPDSASYIEGGRVRLNWTITNPDRLNQLIIVSTKEQTVNKPQVYDFSKGLPTELSRFCQIRDRSLTCANVDTGARLAGKYNFQLQLKAKSAEQSTQQESKVAIQPKPLPKVVSVGSRQSQLEKGKPLTLGWSIENFSQLDQLQVMGQLKGGKPTLLKTYNFQKRTPSELTKQCSISANESLICSNVDIGLPTKAGDYGISLQTVARGSRKQSPLSKPIQVQVKAIPAKILAFTLNGQRSETDPSLFLKVGQVINLNWQVLGDNVKVKLEPLGDVPASGSRTLKATAGLSQITLTAGAEQGQSVKRAFLIQVDVPTPPKPPNNRLLPPQKPALLPKQNVNGLGTN